MYSLGLLGFPLEHSLSPKLHAAALRSCGLQGAYALFPVAPDDMQGLKNLLNRIRANALHGLNVTIPHKQTVVPLLDHLTPTAQAIGAVNTIYLREGKLTGDNTDAPGFLTDLKNFLAGKPETGDHKSALLLGAGGSARAIAHALLHDGWNVSIAARRLEQAQQLAGHVAVFDRVLPIIELRDHPAANLQTFSLLVNTTPLGMAPKVGQSPWPENVPFPKNALVYDLVYNPRETKFVRDARERGLRAANGLGMLIEQAALAFELWTGRAPARGLMRASLD